jgi:hypothetical protein
MLCRLRVIRVVRSGAEAGSVGLIEILTDAV